MKIIFSLIAWSLFASPASFAQGGGHTGGSLCEIAIRDIRKNLIGWIKGGHSSTLDLSSVPITVEKYNEKMIAALTNPKTVVSCPGPTTLAEVAQDLKTGRYTPIFVGGKQKTCDNWPGAKGVQHIRCDFYQFYFGKPNDQYKLIHHEFASQKGVEIEKHTDTESDYSISTQVVQSLRPFTEYRLPEGTTVISYRFPQGLNEISQLVFDRIKAVKRMDFSNLGSFARGYSATELAEYQRVQASLFRNGEPVTQLEIVVGDPVFHFFGERIIPVRVYEGNYRTLVYQIEVATTPGHGYEPEPFYIKTWVSY